MSLDPVRFALFVSWAVTGLGLGMWLYGWFSRGDALRRRRMVDAGMVVIFAAILVRVLLKDGPMNGFDWALAILSPVFIAAALWRLSITRPR